MNVSTSWLIYIVVSGIVYILMTFIAQKLLPPVRLMVALLIGALAVFLSAPSLEIETGQQRIWLGILFMIAYLSPIIVGIYIIWKGGYFNSMLCVKSGRSNKS